MKLDKKKPHGVVTGHPDIGFEQDGIMYRHDGTPFQKDRQTVLTLKRDDAKNGLEDRRPAGK